MMRAAAPPARAEPPRAPAPADAHVPQAPVDVARLHPFKIGFFLAVGALLAWWLGGLLLSLGSVLVLVVVSLFLAVGLNPAVEWLGRRGMSRPLAVLVVVFVFLCAVGLFLVALVPVIADQVSLIVDNA